MADQGSEGLLSPWLRGVRIRAACPYLKGRVLDVGCGSGPLADYVATDMYLGVERDAEALFEARTRHPDHRFQAELPSARPEFDTVAALAVIEHASDPLTFLEQLTQRLAPGLESRIICTTPRPWVRLIHEAGAHLGLFSIKAAEEHERLLDRDQLERLAASCRLSISLYHWFLFGANQLLVLHRA